VAVLNPREIVEKAQAIFAPIVEEAGYLIEEIKFETHSKERFLTVFVDSESTINLDQVAAISRLLSAQIDENDVFGDQPFNLEVTTPGIDRPLTAPRHFRKNIGRLVSLNLNEGKIVKGRIESAAEDSCVVDGVTYPFQDIKRAVIEIEFNKPKAGK
jgi:ribosome maturation factor RimP